MLGTTHYSPCVCTPNHHPYYGKGDVMKTVREEHSASTQTYDTKSALPFAKTFPFSEGLSGPDLPMFILLQTLKQYTSWTQPHYVYLSVLWSYFVVRQTLFECCLSSVLKLLSAHYEIEKAHLAKNDIPTPRFVIYKLQWRKLYDISFFLVCSHAPPKLGNLERKWMYLEQNNFVMKECECMLAFQMVKTPPSNNILPSS